MLEGEAYLLRVRAEANAIDLGRARARPTIPATSDAWRAEFRERMRHVRARARQAAAAASDPRELLRRVLPRQFFEWAKLDDAESAGALLSRYGAEMIGAEDSRHMKWLFAILLLAEDGAGKALLPALAEAEAVAFDKALIVNIAIVRELIGAI